MAEPHYQREELIKIRNRAEEEANCEGLNKGWKRAYLRLADAADHLDAMNARCTEKVKNGIKPKT